MSHDPQRYVPSLHYRFLTPFYDILMPFAGERYFRRRLTESAAIKDGQSVLDLGCGTGTQVILLKKQYPACDVTGLDYDRDALALALRKIRWAALDTPLVQGTAFGLPFAEGCFDRVVSSLVFHHLTTENKAKTLREVYRTLRPCGEFLLADFGIPRGLFMSFLARMMRLVEKSGDNMKGLLPVMMAQVGFLDVALVLELPSPFGTVAFYRGSKPG